MFLNPGRQFITSECSKVNELELLVSDLVLKKLLRGSLTTAGVSGLGVSDGDIIKVSVSSWSFSLTSGLVSGSHGAFLSRIR